MISLTELNELAARVAREEHAAAMAKCTRSRQAHLGLAWHYQQQIAQVDAVQETMRISLG